MDEILIDDCIPRKFKNSLRGHEGWTVPEVGLAGKKNGELLSLAERQGFEIFLTMDKGIEYEANLAGHRIAVIVLRARSNRLADLLPHTQACLTEILSMKPGQVKRIGD